MPPASYEQTRTTVARSSRRCASALRISCLYVDVLTLLHFGTVAFATMPEPAASAGGVRIRALASSHSSSLPQTPRKAVSSSSTYLRDTRRGKFHGKGREASPPPFSANPTRRAPKQVSEGSPARRTHSFWQSHSPPASQPVSQSSAAFSSASNSRLYDDTSAVSRLHLGCVPAASLARATPHTAAGQHPKHAQPEAILLRQRGGRRVDGGIR